MKLRRLTICAALVMFFTAIANSQTTGFSYQAEMKNGAAAANGSFDFEFRLFDAAAGGTQIGSTVTRNLVTVSNGIFSVNLDFGPGFPGALRYLEIRVRQSGGGAFTTLLPRQPVTSAPYAIKSLSADNAANANNATTANSAATATNFTGNLSGDVTGTQGSTTVGRLQGRNVAATAPSGGQVLKYNAASNQWQPDTDNTASGGANAILNQTTQQANANFNISGNGTAAGTLSANRVNADSQFDIGGNRILVAFLETLAVGIGTSLSGLDSTFVGFNAGNSNTFDGTQNSFFGRSAGEANVSGATNSFFGANSGLTNVSGGNNSFFGKGSGENNTIGSDNSFFGADAGSLSTGNANTLVGVSAGFNNTADGNSFFGRSAGVQNTSGANNSIFGRQAGRDNTTGSENSFFGYQAGLGNGFGVGNSFFGTRAGFNNCSTCTAPLDGSENSFFGRDSGLNNTVGVRNSFFGSKAGEGNNVGDFNSFYGSFSGYQNTSGISNTFLGAQAGGSNTTGSNNTAIGNFSNVGSANLDHATAIGANAVVTSSNRVQLGRAGVDTVAIGSFGLGGGPFSEVCINTNGNVFINCSASSQRFKESVQPLRQGLNAINRLRPVTFNWRDGGESDIGLIAEEVAAVDPLLATYGKDGEVEGVKYKQINVILINAVKEQQAQIDALRVRLRAIEKQLRKKLGAAARKR